MQRHWIFGPLATIAVMLFMLPMMLVFGALGLFLSSRKVAAVSNKLEQKAVKLTCVPSSLGGPGTKF